MAMPTLPISIVPRTGEGARGYLRRLADANSYLRFGQFCRSIGISSRMGPLSPDRLWDRLAVATGLPAGELDRLRWQLDPVLGRNGLTLAMGTKFSRSFLHSTTLRFCPECVAEDLCLKELWSLSYFVACPRHRKLLVEICRCGSEVMPALGGPWQCGCSRDYREFTSNSAPAGVIAACSAIADLLSAEQAGDRGPPPISAPHLGDYTFTTANDFVSVLHLLGRAAATPAEHDRPYSPGWLVYRKGDIGSTPLSVELDRVSGAVEIMSDWPQAYWKLLDRIRGRNADGTGKDEVRRAFATEIGYSLLYPIRGSNGLPLAPIHNESQRYCVEQMGVKRTARNLSTHHPLALRLYSNMNLKSVAKLCGAHPARPLTRRCFVHALDSVTQAELHMDNIDLAALVGQRTKDIFDRCNNALFPSEARLVLEGSYLNERLAGWEADDLLPHSIELSTIVGMRVYDTKAVHIMLDRLDAVAIGRGEAGALSPLPTASKRAGILRTGYTKTDMLRDILSGALPVYATRARPRLGDLLIDERAWKQMHIPRLCAERQERLEYAAYSLVNIILEQKLGAEAKLPLREYVALRANNGVRVKVDLYDRADRPTLRPHYRYHIQDMIEYARSRAKK